MTSFTEKEALEDLQREYEQNGDNQLYIAGLEDLIETLLKTIEEFRGSDK